MVRLVSSRIHRCYSRNGGQSSARNERLTDATHLFACLLLLGNHNPHMLSIIPTALFDYIGAIGGFLLVSSCLSDVQATLTAHRMFYKWSKPGKKPNTFWSTPTKIDALISVCCLLASIFYAGATTPFVKSTQDVHVQYAAIASAMFFGMGAIINIVASIPSLDFRVPGGVARAQNTVVLLFILGSVCRLCSAVEKVMGGDTNVQSRFTERLSLMADILVLFGALLNYMRVMVLLRTVQHWATDEIRGENERPPRGLLSWFKSSRSNPELSDYESDVEENGFQTDEDGARVQASNRRSTWSKM